MSTFISRAARRKSSLGGPVDDRLQYLEPDQLQWIEQWAESHEGDGAELIQDLLDHITILEIERRYIRNFLTEDEPLH